MKLVILLLTVVWLIATAYFGIRYHQTKKSDSIKNTFYRNQMVGFLESSIIFSYFSLMFYKEYLPANAQTFLNTASPYLAVFITLFLIWKAYKSLREMKARLRQS